MASRTRAVTALRARSVVLEPSARVRPASPAARRSSASSARPLHVEVLDAAEVVVVAGGLQVLVDLG